MWNYRQDIDLDTSIKISPACHDWQSACWFTLKGLKMWRILFGDLSLGFLLALSFSVIGIGFIAVNVLRRKWKERELPVASVPEEIEAFPEPMNEDNQVVETLPPKDPIDQDLNEPMLSKISIPATETLESPALNVEEITPETEAPIPDQKKTKTRTKNKLKDIIPLNLKQPKTKIPIPSIKPPKLTIIKKDQHQPNQKLAPVKRSTVVPKPVGKPQPRRTASTLRDENESPEKAPNQADTRSRSANPKTPHWKN